MPCRCVHSYLESANCGRGAGWQFRRSIVRGRKRERLVHVEIHPPHLFSPKTRRWDEMVVMCVGAGGGRRWGNAHQFNLGPSWIIERLKCCRRPFITDPFGAVFHGTYPEEGLFWLPYKNIRGCQQKIPVWFAMVRNHVRSTPVSVVGKDICRSTAPIITLYIPHF